VNERPLRDRILASKATAAGDARAAASTPCSMRGR
jgi:hypothetical protein